MFFYRVSFPSSLGCPEAGFLIFLLYMRPPEDVSLELQPRAESVRQGEAERRPSLRLWHPCCSPPRTPHTPLQPPSRELPPETRSSRAAGKGSPAQAPFIPTRRLASLALVAPARPRTDTRGKSICTVSCATPAVTLMTR